MDEKELYCLGLHFKYLFEQGVKNMPFNYAQSCEHCKYFTTCKGEWLEMRDALERSTGIHVNIIRR